MIQHFRAEEIQLAVGKIITRVLLKRLLIGWEPKEFLSLLPVICLRSDLSKEKTLTSFEGSATGAVPVNIFPSEIDYWPLVITTRLQHRR